MLPIDILCLTRLIAFTNFLGSIVAAQSSTASFEYPPSSEDLKINYNDAVVVSWTSNFNQTWLYVWCVVGQSTLAWGIFSVNASGFYTYLPASVDRTQTTWPVGCHLELVYNQIANQGIDGPSLTISSTKGLPTTYARDITVTATGPATVTVTPSIIPSSAEQFSSSETSTAPTVAQTTSSTVFEQPTGTSLPLTGLSIGEKAGIGVGVTLGSLFIIAVIVFAILQQKKLKKVEDRLSQFIDSDTPKAVQRMLPVKEQIPDFRPNGRMFSELQGREVAWGYELDAVTSQ